MQKKDLGDMMLGSLKAKKDRDVGETPVQSPGVAEAGGKLKGALSALQGSQGAKDDGPHVKADHKAQDEPRA